MKDNMIAAIIFLGMFSAFLILDLALFALVTSIGYIPILAAPLKNK